MKFSAQQLLELASSIQASGLGTTPQAQEVIYWIVCSGRATTSTIEPLARDALTRVTAQGATAKQAVRDMSFVDPSSPDPFASCPA